MRIFVSEYVCGGSWPEGIIPVSLEREGRAMFEALVCDLANLDAMEVLATWDERLLLPTLTCRGRVRICSVPAGGAASENGLRAALEAEAALVIAPELDGSLGNRCRQLRRAGIDCLNCTDQAIALCGDKFALFRHCQSHGIPTIDTHVAGAARLGFPCVVKRRDGAGSTDMRLMRSQQEWDEFFAIREIAAYLVQPYVFGRALSVAAIIHQGKPQVVLPVAEQRLSRDGRFQYQGGSIPARDVEQPRAEELIHHVVATLPGLHGYVGFDVIVPADHSDHLRLVEINPRLTTSYVGYRRICRENLASWLLQPDLARRPQFSGSIVFDADGRVRERA